MLQLSELFFEAACIVSISNGFLDKQGALIKLYTTRASSGLRQHVLASTLLSPTYYHLLTTYLTLLSFICPDLHVTVYSGRLGGL